jgi:iron complex outermembrane receptor protein
VDNPAPGKNLFSLSLEELGDIEVTSVSGRAEKLSSAPASIYVITGEDIRRSGVTSLPEALRLAPNLQVARVTTGGYAISARGFNNGIGNKLLVLIDGRAVYTPLFSTVNWDSHYVVLEDVERIEVVSGPGGTLWGANAVNGVINVITRSSKDTLGALVAAGGGDDEVGGTVRYGGALGAEGAFRVYGTGFTRQNSERDDGRSVTDGWQTGQAGFRSDWGDAARSFTLQGDSYRGKADPGTVGPPEIAGSNILARWRQRLSGTSDYYVQMFYDVTERDDPFTYRDEAKTVDVEFQHSFALTGAQKILWGGGYRRARDYTQTHFNASNLLPQVFIPAERSLEWSNVFVQDEIALSSDVTATIGLKAEKNDYTGTEYLPSARLAWKLNETDLLWTALSRAVRAPARVDRDFYIYLQLPGFPLIPVIQGGPDFQSEVVKTAEIGYRSQPSSSVSYSVTTFYNYYDSLRSGQSPPAVVQNMMEGVTYGVETWGNYQPTTDWRLSAGYTLLVEHLKLKPESRDPNGPKDQGNDPRSTWQLRSAWNITERHQLDLMLRHVSMLPDPNVPSYTALDGNVNWRVQPGVDVSLAMRNIVGPSHPEFGSLPTRSEFGRSVFLKVVWKL